MKRAHVAIGALLLVAACSAGAHSAKILDIPLNVSVTSIRLARAQPRPPIHNPAKTSILARATVYNHSGQPVWADACHAEAFGDGHQLLYTFGFNFAVPAGAYVEPHGRFTGTARAIVSVSSRRIKATTSTTATCQAWDWGDHPPI